METKIECIKRKIEDITFRRLIRRDYRSQEQYEQDRKTQQQGLYNNIYAVCDLYLNNNTPNNEEEIIINFHKYEKGIIKLTIFFEVVYEFNIELDYSTNTLKVVSILI